MQKYNVLASKQNIKNDIKGGKEFADKIMDSAQITSLLKQYYIKYGEERFIKHLISSYSEIRGGISFNNSKDSLDNLIQNFQHSL